MVEADMAFLDDLQRKDCPFMAEGCLMKPSMSIALESYMFKGAITFIFT